MICCLLVIFICVFGNMSAYQLFPCPPDQTSSPQLSCGSEWTLLHRALFNSFAPVSWSIALMTLALLCSQGDGGWVGVVLEHHVWVVPARLSFGAYLIHPIILNLTVLSQADKVTHPIQFSLPPCVYA